MLRQIFFFLFLIIFIFHNFINCLPLRTKRAFSYIANETACTVDNIIYRDGDPIPTDDPCEICRCRPPGFTCVLRHCEIKTGCRAIRRIGECCPLYQCGCEHNGIYYKDGERIHNAESPCYSCYCQGSSITCSLADCQFRFDCEPEYVIGQCCPRYDHCPPEKGIFITKIPQLFADISTTNHLPISNNKINESMILPSLVTFNADFSKINNENNLNETNISTERNKYPQSRIETQVNNFTITEKSTTIESESITETINPEIKLIETDSSDQLINVTNDDVNWNSRESIETTTTNSLNILVNETIVENKSLSFISNNFKKLDLDNEEKIITSMEITTTTTSPEITTRTNVQEIITIENDLKPDDQTSLTDIMDNKNDVITSLYNLNESVTTETSLNQITILQNDLTTTELPNNQ